MTPHVAPTDEFIQLMSDLAEDRISPAQIERLDELLRTDPANCQNYVDFMAIVTRLAWIGDDEPAGVVPFTAGQLPETLAQWTSDRGDASASRSLPPRFDSAPSSAVSAPFPTLSPPAIDGSAGYFTSGWPAAYLVATVIFGIGLVIGAIVHVSAPTVFDRRSAPLPSPIVALRSDVVGRITGMVDCEWEGSGGRVQSSEAAAQKSEIISHKSVIHLGDRLALRSGLLELTYDTGATVILQGPVTYDVESPAGGYLAVGKLSAKLEKRSEVRGPRLGSENQKAEIRNHQFAVRTPTALVTDLGTEFGVTVSGQGTTQVHVLQGTVEARRVGPNTGAGVMKRLGEGMGVEIGRDRGPIETVKFSPQSYVRSLTKNAESVAEAAYIQAVLADKPLGYWPLNEPAGSRKFLDRSGNGIHGYAMRALTAGVPGPLSDGSRAVAFHGKGYIDFGRRDQFAMKNDITIEAWVWIGDVQPSSHVVSILGRGGDGYIGWGLFAGRRKDLDLTNAANPIVPYLIGYDVRRFPFPLSAGKPIESRWLHLAAAVDSSNTAHLYLNGVCRGSLAASKSGSVGPVWLEIGGAELIDEDFWRGRIAHVAIYPRALRAEQIVNHYNQRGRSEKEALDKQP